MSILRRCVCLSQHVVSPRLSSAASLLGCLPASCNHHLPSYNHQYLPAASTHQQPPVPEIPVVKATEKEPEVPPARFPEVWRDRFSAAIQLASTPEARSLTSL